MDNIRKGLARMGGGVATCEKAAIDNWHFRRHGSSNGR